jgi:hypothetical protein
MMHSMLISREGNQQYADGIEASISHRLIKALRDVCHVFFTTLTPFMKSWLSSLALRAFSNFLFQIHFHLI